MKKEEIKKYANYWETANLTRMKEWADYLRTDGLKQIRKFLCTDRGLCCLGHAENVIGDHLKDRHWERARRDRSSWSVITDNETDSSTLSRSAVHWFGFSDPNPDLLIPDLLENKANGCGWMPAAELNDTYKFTLTEIADCIDFTIKQFKRVRRSEKKKAAKS